MAKIIVINEVEPRELPLVLDKILGEPQCPLMRQGGNLVGGMMLDVSSLVRSFVESQTKSPMPTQSKPEPEKKNNIKGGKTQ